MHRRLVWVSIAAFTLVAAVTVGVIAVQSDPDPVRVAAVYNSSGGMKWLDLPGLEGFLLAADQINADGGVLGQMVEVVEVDGTTDTTELTRLVSELAEAGDVVAVGGVNDPIHAISPVRGALRRADGGLITFSHSEMALAVGEVTEASGIPFVTAGSTLTALPDLVGDDLFMLAASHDAHASAIADFASDELGAGSAWVLTDNGAQFATSLTESFQQRWRERGGEIIADDSYPPGVLDISSQISRLRELPEEPDLLVVSSLQNDGGYLTQQLREAGLSQPIMLADVVDPRYIVAMGGDMTDVYLSTHGSPVDPDEEVQDFVTAYQAKYGDVPESATAMLGYDTMRLIADAIGRAGSAERRLLSQTLAQTDGFAALTGRLSYPVGTHVPAKTITILRYQEGEPIIAAKIGPN